jgi:hypothetical protein
MKTALLIDPNICPPVDNVLLASHHTDGHLDFAGNIPGRSSFIIFFINLSPYQP